MLKGVYGKVGAVAALVAGLAASALGQHSHAAETYRKYGGPSGDPLVGSDGKPIVLRRGDVVRIQGSDVQYTVGDSGVVLPIEVGVVVNGKQEARTHAPRSQHSVGLYPLSIFSIGGLLRQPDNSLVGGTRSIVGSIFSYDVVSNLDYGRRFEFGGFYFRPYDGNDGDLYQIAGRYFPNKQIGFQVAYLNSTEAHGNSDASSFSYHVLIDVTAVPTGRPDARQITARLGVGVLNNLSKEYQLSDNQFVSRSTFNFSTFVDLSYSLGPRVSLNATEWYIRDRNADLNRFSVGASYRF